MKKLIVLSLILGFTIVLSCNNGNCGCTDVDEFYTPQSSLYWYVINKPTTPVTYFYATSSTQLTSATQVSSTGWHVSQGVPRGLSGTIDTLPSESVVITDLPYNLQQLLQ